MPNNYQLRPHTHISLGAMLSVVGAIASIFVSLSGRGLWGLSLAIVAIFLGLLGFISSASAGVRGGIISMAAIGLAVLDIPLAILVMVGKLTKWLL